MSNSLKAAINKYIIIHTTCQPIPTNSEDFGCIPHPNSVNYITNNEDTGDFMEEVAVISIGF